MDDLIMKCVASGVSVGFRDKATRELVGVRLSSILSSKPKTQPPPKSVPPEVVSLLFIQGTVLILQIYNRF